MKEQFAGYYQPTESEIADIWENCLFVLDANVLLNLYRYSPDARRTFIKTLTAIAGRLWIPHQAALEYHFNRLPVISQQMDRYDRVSSTLNKVEAELDQLITKEHLIEIADEDYADFKVTFDEFYQKLEEKKGQYPSLFTNDRT